MAAQGVSSVAAATGEPFSQVELSISCNRLKDLDHFSKSDPAVFLYEKKLNEWIKLGRTEVIDNNLNPKFSKTFLLEYRFEDIQTLKFVVLDIDDKKHVDDAGRHDLIGQIECTLADIVTAGQQYKRTLRDKGASRGEIVIVAEEVQDSKYTIQMQLSAGHLDKKDFFGKSDPFFEISKSQEGGGFTVVYRSEPILKTLDPSWKKFDISIRKLCSGDWDRTVKITVWDWNKSGDHDYIGSCTTTLREITPEKGGEVRTLDIINPDIKKKKKKYTNSGTLNFVSVRATPEFSFMDYIKGGCQISLIVAIDFTASNGKPHLQTSLHYNNPYQDNEYVHAIKAIGSVLAPYDSDQLIPAYGFGARMPDGQVSHCFPLNFNDQRPDVFGVQGILEAYHYAVNHTELYGPTNFSSFLDKAISSATGSVTQESQNYTLLLVITDGVISDMSRTVDRIVAASKLPLSIVIVGVGGADFSNMEVLDADDKPLLDKYGQKMTRDIVQFVPLRQFQSRSGANFSLARETLSEIPNQFTSFMKANNIKPNPPPLRHQHSQASFQPNQGEAVPSAPYIGGAPGYPVGGGGVGPYQQQSPYPVSGGQPPAQGPPNGGGASAPPYPL